MGRIEWKTQNRLQGNAISIDSCSSDAIDASSDEELGHGSSGSANSATWLHKPELHKPEGKPEATTEKESSKSKSEKPLKGFEKGDNVPGGGMKRRPMILRSARQWSSSFWTRTALVIILALSVMATTLVVLRLYHATVYDEASGLGRDLQQEMSNMARLTLAAFIGDMAPGVLVLAGNLHHQGMVDVIARDPHDERARKMLWETFAARPLAVGLSYATDMGAEIYARSFPSMTSILIEAQPQNPAAPYVDWTARFMPVDPSLGEPLYPGSVPSVPFIPYNRMDHHVQALRQRPGTIHWWTGPILADTGEFLMHYIASCVLVSTVNAASANESSPVDDSMLTTGPPQVIGTVQMAYSTRSLTESFQQLNLRGGRLFLSRAKGGMLVVANQGRLFIPAEGAEGPLTITAEQSDDPIIAAAAHHLRRVFSGDVDTERVFNATEGGQDDAALAAAAGLCWEGYRATVSIDGRPWYLHCQGLVYGGAKSRLCMVAVLVVPRDAIMGHVDSSQRRSLFIVMGVTGAIGVLGMAFVYFSTVHVGRIAHKKKELEGQVEKQEGEIQSMAKELDEMRALLPGDSGKALDLRTPMEKVHDLLGELADASGGPGSDVLAAIQQLLRMPELHMPIVLQQRMRGGALGSTSLPGEPIGQDSQVLDDDVTAWLRSTVMRLPSVAASHAALSHGNSVRTIAADSSGSSSCHSDGVASTFRPSRFSEEIQLDIVRDLVGLSAPDLTRQEPTLAWGQEGGTPTAGGGMPGTFSSPAGRYALNQTGALLHAPDTNGGHDQMHGELRATLDRAGQWNFDSWELLEVSMGRPILWMGLEVFRRMSLMREFRLPLEKLAKFLAALDNGMPSNGYHNSTHIADVTNSLFHLLKSSGVGAYLTRLDMLAAVIAALVHDFRHPGLNNDFVVKSADDLALRYNDLTVLENYHVSEAFFLMKEAGLNILEGLNEDDFKYVRRMVIEIVLASDLKRHFEMVEAFKAHTKDKESPLSKSIEGHRLLLMQVALKVADIGHAAKKLDIHRKWTDAITEEFYLQGDKERAAGLKVSPFMDRENNNLAKSQLGFFSFIALPLFQAWVEIFPNSQPILEEVTANIKYWENLRDTAVG
eukprot:jgi/Mesvir1/14698/Mv05355-RA.1